MNRKQNFTRYFVSVHETVIEGRRVSGTVLVVVVKLAGFDRGAIFLTGKNKGLKQAVSLGIKNDLKAVESLVRRSGITPSDPVDYDPDTTKLNWFRTAHQLKGSLMLSYACGAFVRGKKQYGTLYLDSETKIEPIKESVMACLSRLARVTLAALLRDQIISVPTVSAIDFLTGHSIRELERE